MKISHNPELSSWSARAGHFT